MCYCLIQQAALISASGSSFVINLYVNIPLMLKIVVKIFLQNTSLSNLLILDTLTSLNLQFTVILCKVWSKAIKVNVYLHFGLQKHTHTYSYKNFTIGICLLKER